MLVCVTRQTTGTCLYEVGAELAGAAESFLAGIVEAEDWGRLCADLDKTEARGSNAVCGLRACVCTYVPMYVNMYVIYWDTSR